MAIRDALWACPFCSTVDSIRPGQGLEICSTCGATFEPGPRATITGKPTDGAPLNRSVVEWESLLPDLEASAAVPPPATRAIIRKATPARAVYQGSQLLGWAESFGPKTAATVELGDTTVRFRTGEGPGHEWPLETVTAVQPSSSNVQLRRRNGDLVSFAFPESSVRLWEMRFQAAVRRAYSLAGKGVIAEFHPTIRSS